MGKYIHYFTAVTDYNTARSENYIEPWVSLTEEGSLFDVDYNKTEEEKRQELLRMPLTFEITGDGNINWKTTNTEQAKTIEYKLNDGAWTSITATAEGVQIPVVNGDIVQFRGDNDNYGMIDRYNNYFNGTTCGFKVKGNIMSLINSTVYPTMTSFPNGNSDNFNSLFNNCTGLTDASELILPATTLTEGCYDSMFYGCTSLVNSPELPATTLVNYCYSSMFDGCTSLVQAPELPATTLTAECYYHMFSGCTNLSYIKCLATNISAARCTSSWVSDVASTGTFIIQNGTQNIWKFGANGIPSGWTVYNMSGDDVTSQIHGEGGGIS